MQSRDLCSRTASPRQASVKAKGRHRVGVENKDMTHDETLARTYIWINHSDTNKVCDLSDVQGFREILSWLVMALLIDPGNESRFGAMSVPNRAAD